jgi:hypothetical protein
MSNNNQQFIQDQLNAVLKKLADLVSCNTNKCKKEKKIEELKKKLLTEQLNAATAQIQLQNAERNLLLFQGGMAKYNKKIKADFESQAYQIAETFNQNFQEEISNVTTNIDTYQSLLSNYTNVLELNQRITKENLLIKKEIAITSGNIITNNRRSIYENQIIDHLHYWYGWIKFLYILIIIGYVIGLFLLPWETPRRNYIIILILLCIYPFIINPLVYWLLNIYYQLVNIIKYFY